ncbi:MAG: gliding motility-associated C-terminal domain-containing protein [Crocinitomicaceae bacterium]|nr:gliding motility-associated C-terminal domain-containing protein [Crocinitomicaceae bacterium]
MKKFLHVLIIIFLPQIGFGQLFPNGDFELGSGAGCACATSFTCNNDAGRVVDGTHPVYAVGNQGCVTMPTNYCNSLGAHSGSGYMYFYAGADNFRHSTAINFVGGEEICLSVWYCGPQGSGPPGQNTANSHFSFGIDGVQVGPDVLVPTNTPWTQHTLTVTMTAGAHTFYILSGGAAQYSIWFDDFEADLCSSPCDGSWTVPTPVCSDDADINLAALITGDAGGTWSGTGVTGNMFDPSVGTQSITYTAPCGSAVTQTITVTTAGNAAWNPPATLCSNAADVDLTSLITGTSGGTWSGIGVSGNLFDPSAGTQSITYTVGTAPCQDVSTEIITVTPSSDPAWTSPGTICESSGSINLDATISGTAGGIWSGSGVTGSTFDPTGLSGAIAMTYTVGTAPCIGTLTQNITVISDVDPSWNVPLSLCTGSPTVDLSTYITGTPGGTWSGTGISGTNFDPAMGTQTITYTVGAAPCIETSSQTINVTPGLSSAWTSPGTICANGGIINLTPLITGDAGGTWSGTGVTGTNFDPSALSGPISITYSVGLAPCVSTTTQDITVSADVNPAWTVPTNLCNTAAPVDLTTFITGTTGGTWSGTGISGSTFNPSSGSQSITYSVGTVPCQETLTLTINVDNAPDPSWSTVTVCQFGPDVNLNSLISGTPGGTWSGTGVSGSVFDPSVGTQAITYTITSGACTETLTQNITISNPTLNITATNISCYGQTNGSATVVVSNGSGSYSYSWNSMPVQTTATATNLPSGTYTVTVTDLIAGCSVSADVTIIEPAQIVLDMDSTSACSPGLGSASVQATGGTGSYTYVWNNSSSTSNAANDLDSAMQTVLVTDASGCTATDSVLVIVYPAPVVTISSDTTILNGGEAQLWVIGGGTYVWTPFTDLSCDDCANPVADPLDTTVYCVTVTDANGCQASACTVVRVEIVCGDIFVPNAFSPNNDDENDILCVYSNCMEVMTFRIYDRWGEKVFECSDQNICWDGTYKGKPVNTGVFVYVLEGYLITGDKVSKSGNISLVR